MAWTSLAEKFLNILIILIILITITININFSPIIIDIIIIFYCLSFLECHDSACAKVNRKPPLLSKGFLFEKLSCLSTAAEGWIISDWWSACWVSGSKCDDWQITEDSQFHAFCGLPSVPPPVNQLWMIARRKSSIEMSEWERQSRFLRFSRTALKLMNAWVSWCSFWFWRQQEPGHWTKYVDTLDEGNDEDEDARVSGHVVAVEGHEAAAGWHLYCSTLTSSSPQMPRSDLCVCSRLPAVLTSVLIQVFTPEISIAPNVFLPNLHRCKSSPLRRLIVISPDQWWTVTTVDVKSYNCLDLSQLGNQLFHLCLSYLSFDGASVDLCYADTLTGPWWLAPGTIGTGLSYSYYFTALRNTPELPDVSADFTLYLVSVVSSACLFLWIMTSSSLGVACLWGELLWVASDRRQTERVPLMAQLSRRDEL